MSREKEKEKKKEKEKEKEKRKKEKERERERVVARKREDRTLDRRRSTQRRPGPACWFRHPPDSGIGIAWHAVMGVGGVKGKKAKKRAYFGAQSM